MVSMTRILKHIVPAAFFMVFAFAHGAGAFMAGEDPPNDMAAQGQWTVVIDPGHGGEDSGAIGPGAVEEKKITLAIAERLAGILRERHGFRVLLTRRDDTFVPLRSRTAFANKSGADVFISIHANSALKKDINGIETFFLNVEATDDDARRLAAMENSLKEYPVAPAGAGDADDLQEILSDLTQTIAHHESGSLAEALQESLVAGTGRENRGVKQAPFTVLSGAIMPAALVEVGFISNPFEGKRIASEKDQLKTADSIADGIAGFRKLTARGATPAKGNGQNDAREARQKAR